MPTTHDFFALYRLPLSALFHFYFIFFRKIISLLLIPAFACEVQVKNCLCDSQQSGNNSEVI